MFFLQSSISKIDYETNPRRKRSFVLIVEARGKRDSFRGWLIIVSEQDRLNAYRPKDSKDDAFFKDSRNIGLSAKKRAQDLGVDLGKGFEEKLDKLRTDPASVLKDSE